LARKGKAICMPQEIFLLTKISKIDRGIIFLNFKDIKYSADEWSAVSVTSDPQIYLYRDSGAPIDSLSYRFVQFDLFSDKVTQGQLIWWLQDGRWQTSFTFRINRGWNKYCFDMNSIATEGNRLGSGIKWEGLISTLRLDPGEKECLQIKIKNVKMFSDLKSGAKYRMPVSSNRHSLIEADPNAQANIKANWEDCRDLPDKVKSKPVLIYAEISTKCNLRCRMCGRYNYKIPSSQQGFMKKNVFLKLTKLFTPGCQLAIFGRGESLLHPNFIDFLETACAAQVKVGFNTNGLLLNHKMAKAMVEYQQTNITFSCSAGSPETYHKIHGVDGWGKLWDNIDMLNMVKVENDNGCEVRFICPSIYLEFVSQLGNIHELPLLVKKAFDFDIMGLTVINMTAHSSAMEKERMNIPENLALANRYYKEAVKMHNILSNKTGRVLDFRLPDNFSMLDKKFMSQKDSQLLEKMIRYSVRKDVLKSDNFCLEPWKTFYVRFDGTVAPCVITGRVLGNLNKNKAEEIWNGEMYQKFRRRMKSENKPYECIHCHFFPGPKRYDINLDDKSTYKDL